jgi:hypothetical protein
MGNCAWATRQLGRRKCHSLGFSGYLGKRWADRALEEERHKFAGLNLQLQNQLEIATRKLQIELDALGVLHKIRTQEECNRVAGLWKRIANLRMYFNGIVGRGIGLAYADPEVNKKWEEKKRAEFDKWCNDTNLFLQEEMLFVPKQIADAAQEALRAAFGEQFIFAAFGQESISLDVKTAMTYRQASNEWLDKFNSATEKLELLMRAYINGQ